MLPGAPDLALRSERAANASGARLLGFTEVQNVGDVLGPDDALLVVDDALDGVDPSVLARASVIVYVGTSLPAAIDARVVVVLPSTSIVEEEGTLTNLRGRVQRFLQAKAAPGIARPMWYVLADLLAAAGGKGAYYTSSDVFVALSQQHAAFADMHYDTIGFDGAMVSTMSEASR